MKKIINPNSMVISEQLKIYVLMQYMNIWGTVSA